MTQLTLHPNGPSQTIDGTTPADIQSWVEGQIGHPYDCVVVEDSEGIAEFPIDYTNGRSVVDFAHEVVE